MFISKSCTHWKHLCTAVFPKARKIVYLAKINPLKSPAKKTAKTNSVNFPRVKQEVFRADSSGRT